MATVILVMDRSSFRANTDNIVVVDPDRMRLTWVPRDLWCAPIRHRINRAYAIGGAEQVADALAEHGFHAEHTVCLSRAAVEAGLEGATVMMPIRERLELWYPSRPTMKIEAGRKRVVFEPPVERLSGERIHQWVGARYSVDGTGSDFQRIRRQRELVAVMLGDGFEFRRFLERPEATRVSSPAAIDELAGVRADWDFKTLGGLEPVTLDGKKVLIPTSGPPGDDAASAE